MIFSIFVFLIAYNFWKAMFPGPLDPDVAMPQTKKIKTSDSIKRKKSKIKKDEIKEVKRSNKNINLAYQDYLKNFLPDAQRRDVKCSEVADEIFKDPSFIDVEDPFYKTPMNIIERLHDVYTKTLIRTEVVSAYGALSALLVNQKYEGTKLTPSEYRNQMGLLEYYCRPEMSLRFIETVMEANKRYKFSPRMKKDIFDMSLSMLDAVIGEMFTTNNLIYGLGFFKLLIDNDLLPKEAGEEIVPLFDKVLEHHKGFSNIWQREKEANENSSQWSLLQEDHKRREELGLEFKELMRQIKTRYYARK